MTAFIPELPHVEKAELDLSIHMLDLNFVREHFELVERKTAERGLRVDFRSFRTLDEQRRRAITEAEKLKALRNKATEEI